MSVLKPNTCAVVSYNTPKHLIEVLDLLKAQGTIGQWIFIEHRPEADDTKPHSHLLFELNVEVDAEVFQAYFAELRDGSPVSIAVKKYNGYICKSLYDWWLYGLHDIAYLMRKKMRRQYHYTASDFESSDAQYWFDIFDGQRPYDLSEIARYYVDQYGDLYHARIQAVADRVLNPNQFEAFNYLGGLYLKAKAERGHRTYSLVDDTSIEATNEETDTAVFDEKPW